MKQSLLSVAAASALIAMSTASFAADIEHNDTQSEAKSLYQDDAIDQLEGNTFLGSMTFSVGNHTLKPESIC